VSPGAVADFARFRVDHPLWTVTRSGPSLLRFTAKRGGVTVTAATLGELAGRIRAAERHPPG
jgi:hypothetical protein